MSLPSHETTITFTGASDDLIYIDGDLPGCDEYNIFKDELYIATFEIVQILETTCTSCKHKETKEYICVKINCFYNGGWYFAVEPVEDENDCDKFKIPDHWIFTTTNCPSSNHSTQLTIEKVENSCIVRREE